MMDNNDQGVSLFDDTSSSIDAPVDTPVAEEDKSYYSDLVGEGKKFTDPEALARGKWESDQFINRLQSENQTLRDELKSRRTIEEFMDQVNSPKSSNTDNMQSTQNNTTPDEMQAGSSNISLEDIESLFEKKSTEREQQRTAQENIRSVKQQMAKHWGNNYQDTLRTKARELDVGPEYLEKLAAEKPSIVMGLMGIKEDPRSFDSSSVVPHNQVRTESRALSGTEVKNQAYYKRMKDNDPDRYFSTEIQQEEYKQAMKLGEEFFTT